jgi:MerR family transcriptional regulator, repressor of the yfmOP operon
VGESRSSAAATETPEATVQWRIGEVAKLTGVTTRTLRYWEELELLQPSNHRASGERLYSPSDVARVTRIRNLQELLGFSLAEVRTVLNAGDVDVLDRVRSELKSENLSQSRHRALLDEGIAANDQLLERLDETLARIQAFRDERAASGVRLRDARRELGDATDSAEPSTLATSYAEGPAK